MRAAIKNRYGDTARLIGGHGGIFKVVVDGKVIYDRSRTGRFPEEQEIFEAIDAISG